MLDTVLERDIYVYQDRVSFDRKIWSKAQDEFKFTVDVQLPDYEDHYSSQIDMTLDTLN